MTAHPSAATETRVTEPPLAPDHVGDELVERLIGYGIRRVFGCPGGQTLPLYNAIAKRRARIEHILMRDERSAGFAADAYARATGTVGCCDATVGPGATNLVSALAEAYTSSVPVLAIVSDVRRDWEHNRRFGAASQAFDQRRLLEGTAKWYGRVEDAGNLAQVLHACLRIATAGRPGPVVLEIPDDVFAGPASRATFAPSPRWARYPRLRPAADPAAIEEAADLLADSRRPLVVAGGGVLIADAVAEVAALAEALDGLVATTMSGKGAIAEDHPRSVGVVGRFGVPMANEALGEADGVVFIGSKVGQTTTLNWTLPTPGAHVVEIDVDAEELGRNSVDSVGIVADAKLGTAALGAALGGDARRSDWDPARIADARQRWWEGPVDYRAEPVPGVLKPQDVVRVLSARMSSEDVLVCDASLSSGWGATRWRAAGAGRSFLAPRGLAGLGWGLPAAIGAAAARSEAGQLGRVYCLAGDGGWAYSLAETETAARHGLPIIAVVLNNSTLGWIRHTADDRYPGEMVSQDFIDVRYGAAASALGAVGTYVTSLDGLGEALDGAADQTAPCVIEVRSCDTETPVISIASTGGGY